MAAYRLLLTGKYSGTCSAGHREQLAPVQMRDVVLGLGEWTRNLTTLLTFISKGGWILNVRNPRRFSYGLP